MCVEEPKIEAYEFKVGIAQWKVTNSPHRLITLGLGSCVGIALYDPFTKIGGLSHVMLPDSTQFKRNENKGKFADTAIPILYEEMVAMGARKRGIIAKLAGGAQMFSSADRKFISNIGERNVEKSIEILKKLGIKVVAKDVGGNRGRTMIFDTSDGSVVLRILGKNIKML